MREALKAARRPAIVGAALLATAGLISLFTDDTVDWAWGAMIVTSFAGIVALLLAVIVAVRSRRPARR